ncbi:MAG: T9SS type A sorting domain-containing protein [Bacteroidia bacterium]|nr:T9SS type A sorting domain-containing protein [Bacteroidia bacterium]
MKHHITLLSAWILSVALFAQTTLTFNYTGSVQTFVVPANVYLLSVDAFGGQGADNGPAPGGLGGRVQALISVNPGDILNIYVGGAGINSLSQPASAFDGGGGVYSYTSCGTAGTGGGGTDIRFNGTTLSDRIVVAGGGGGAGGYVSGNQTYAGGAGGGLIGGDGVIWPSWPQSAGGGGTQSVGGAGGIACCSCPQYTTGGALGVGGNGSGDCAGGGGGGGGYYGGGGSCFGGGGGGSSYTGTNVTQVVHTQGYQTGNGIVIISYNVSSTGIPGEYFSANSVYPNPFRDVLFLNLSVFPGAGFILTDITGRTVLEGIAGAGVTELSTSSLLQGTYLLTISTPEGVFRRTLVKKD